MAIAICTLACANTPWDAIVNGIAAHGGLIPYSATFLVFSDYMRPAIRLAALSELAADLRLHA